MEYGTAVISEIGRLIVSLRFDKQQLKIERGDSQILQARTMKKKRVYRPPYKRRLGALEQLESRKLMVANWQNPTLPCDVDNSSIVAPIDALMLINTINLSGDRLLSGSATDRSSP